MTIEINGEIDNPAYIKKLKARLNRLYLYSGSKTLQSLTALAGAEHKQITDVERIGHVRVEGTGGIDMSNGRAEGNIELLTSLGRADIECDVAGLGTPLRHLKADVTLHNIEAGLLTGRSELGTVTGAVRADLSIGSGGLSGLEGDADVEVAQLEWKGIDLSNLTVSARKEGHDIEAEVDIDNRWVSLSAKTSCVLDGEASQLNLTADVGYLNPIFARLKGPLTGSDFSGLCTIELHGDKPENLWGSVSLSNLNIHKVNTTLALNRLDVSATQPLDNRRQVDIISDWIEAHLDGEFSYQAAAATVSDYLHAALPSLVKRMSPNVARGNNEFNFSAKITPFDPLADFLKLSVRPLTDVNIT
ncbi:MAG: hypothetical protein K2J92_07500, partial [Muribaculaceae bacterium]|nr:hypothetical protein [Muribaculaceae bacterium]